MCIKRKRFRIFPSFTIKQISLLSIIAVLLPIAIFTYYYGATRVPFLVHILNRLYNTMLVQVIGYSFVLFAVLLATAIIMFFIEVIVSWHREKEDNKLGKKDMKHLIEEYIKPLLEEYHGKKVEPNLTKRQRPKGRKIKK